MPFIHHPDPKFAETVRAGAALVPFDDGRAEVTSPQVLRFFAHRGYVTTAERKRPVVAGKASVVQAPAAAPTTVAQVEGDGWVSGGDNN